MVEKKSKEKTKIIKLPLSKKVVLSLNVGDRVLLNGQLLTGRDKIHKYLFHEIPEIKDIPFNLTGTILYHCGPIIRKPKEGFELIAGGPTTSIRMEMYEHQIISDYGIRGVMGDSPPGVPGADGLELWEYAVDWAAGTHVVTGPTIIATEDFDSSPCPPSTLTCIP